MNKVLYDKCLFRLTQQRDNTIFPRKTYVWFVCRHDGILDGYLIFFHSGINNIDVVSGSCPSVLEAIPSSSYCCYVKNNLKDLPSYFRVSITLCISGVCLSIVTPDSSFEKDIGNCGHDVTCVRGAVLCSRKKHLLTLRSWLKDS